MLRKILITSLIIFLVSVSLLYFLLLKPRYELVNLKKIITSHYISLSQNRLNLTALTRLDPNSPNFPIEKDKVLISVSNSNKKGLDELEPVKLSNSQSKLLKKHTGLEDMNFLERNKSILIKQQDLTDQLKETDDKLNKLFRYDPVKDLESGNLTENEKIQSLKAAIEGLNVIKDNISDNEASAQLASAIENTQQNIRAFSDFLGCSSYTNTHKYATFLNQMTLDFSSLRKLALDLEINIIRSPEILELLVDQTNLLLEYDFVLDRIDNHLRKTL
ncbi:hypothetical protein JXA34_03255 [Patescibacteria group bacterium]|nr:hypothetical protein [Patescibacteria group bacterium]